MSDLSGKIILITGAAGAVGSAVAAAIRRAGGVAIASDLGRTHIKSYPATSPDTLIEIFSRARSCAVIAGTLCARI